MAYLTEKECCKTNFLTFCTKYRLTLSKPYIIVFQTTDNFAKRDKKEPKSHSQSGKFDLAIHLALRIVKLKLLKAGLHDHLLMIFTEQWLLIFHVITECDHVKHCPKSLQVAFSGLT